MSRSIRVLIADDHSIVRRGLCALLATEPGIEVVGEARDGQEAVAEAHRLAPDVILMDLVMPHTDGLEAIRQLADDGCRARILVLTSFAADDQVFHSLKAGALGYLLKDASGEELVAAIGRVHRGESALHPAIAHKLLRELAGPRDRAGPALLTDRETEVLKLVARGESNRDIAARLSISEATVRTHMSRILSKLGLDSRTQAVLYALREGLVPLDDTGPLATK
ncbi:MAG: response regulator transcription factor [Anaerolineae bacterium]